MDVGNGVVEYTRRIDSVEAFEMENTSKDNASESRNAGETKTIDDPYSMCCLIVTGKAFLWHQIRCIVAVLFRVGRGQEQPRIVDALLDVEANPRRPQYNMASELPLNLFACDYDDASLEWSYDQESVCAVYRRFQGLWTENQVRATMIREGLKEMPTFGSQNEASFDPPMFQLDRLLPKGKTKVYVPLMEMLKCSTLEEKIESCAKRRKIGQVEMAKSNSKDQKSELPSNKCDT